MLDILKNTNFDEMKAAAKSLAVEHFFSPGVCARQLSIPADTQLVGKIHKYENMNILLKGDMSILIDGELKRIQAPFIVVSPPGTQRVAYTHTDCIWITILGTEETDINLIENEFVVETKQEYLDFKNSQLALDLK